MIGQFGAGFYFTNLAFNPVTSAQALTLEALSLQFSVVIHSFDFGYLPDDKSGPLLWALAIVVWLLFRVLIVQIVKLLQPVPKASIKIVPKQIAKMDPQLATRQGWDGHLNREGGPRGDEVEETLRCLPSPS